MVSKHEASSGRCLPHYRHKGGGANYLCLPDTPQYLRYKSGGQANVAYVHGAEYDTYEDLPLSSVLNHNVPCAVCHVRQCMVILTRFTTNDLQS